MQISRNNLNKLSYYPFVSFGIDNEGTIFYKSKLAELLFPIVKQGTRLNRYTNISFTKSCLNKCIFCGQQCSAFVQTADDSKGNYSVITLFEKSLCSNASELMTQNERRDALFSLMSSQYNEDEHLKMIPLLQSIKHLIHKVNEWRSFTNLYIKQCQFEANGAISLESFMYAIERVVNNRLGLGISIEYMNSNVESSVKMSVSLAVTVLNILSFIVASTSDEKAKIVINKLEDTVSICFSYSSLLELDEINAFSDTSPKIFTLLSGIAMCNENGVNIDFAKSEDETEITLTIPHNENSSMVFSSSDVCERLVVGFYNMLTVFLEN